MVKEEEIIYVYDDFSGNEPILLGKLNVGIINGGEVYSFEYDRGWLAKNKLQINLDPELQPFAGRQLLQPFAGRQFPTGKRIFGIFADASPDRWGRVLIYE